jgi:alpha-L-fucosidase
VKKDWKIVGISDEKAYKVIDGNSHTAWYQAKTQTLPADLIIDLGKEVTLTGFKYLPWQSPDGVISKYQFSVSLDGNNWTIVNEGEFSNIKNNPLLQVKTFTPSKAKFISLRL